MDITNPLIEKYASEYSSPEPEILRRLSRETQAKILKARMLSGHLQGRFLSFISRIIKPDRVLEIGTYTGYSALCLAEGLKKKGLIHTIDHNQELEDFSRTFFREAGMEDKIILHIGEALDIIPLLKETFDLVYIDADKENYVNYLDLILPRVRSGGVILADNVLWSGKVLGENTENDPETNGLIQFNTYVRGHSGLNQVLLPIRDGLTMIEKI